MKIKVATTMLPVNVSVELDLDVLDEEGVENAASEQIAPLYSEHGAEACFVVTFIDDDEEGDADLDWLRNALQQEAVPLWAQVVVCARAHSDGWGDEQLVMAARYGRRYDHPDKIINAVACEEWMIDYNENESEAYADFGKKVAAEDYSISDDSGLFDYIDFEALGRAEAEACVQFHDGDFYVLKEWH